MERQREFEAAKDSLTQYLEENGMRKTIERYAVLEAIFSVGKHVTIDELYELMSEDLRVSRGTVYNSVELLRRVGLVVIHQFGSYAEYEFCSAKKRHFHKVCIHCGTVVEFANDELQKQIDNLHIRGFMISDVQLTINGTCSKCRAKILRLRRKNKKQ